MIENEKIEEMLLELEERCEKTQSLFPASGNQKQGKYCQQHNIPFFHLKSSKTAARTAGSVKNKYPACAMAQAASNMEFSAYSVPAASRNATECPAIFSREIPKYG